MNKKFTISLVSITLTFLLVLGCDLSSGASRNRIDGISDFKKKYIDDSNYKCLGKKESESENSQVKLDENNNNNRSYYSRVSNVSNYYDKTHVSCKRQ
ncbi:DUF5425 family lipoprotein (plasmid) [Borrelia sp. CA_690]|uniref:Lipoprotein n=1 Tax=Borrelia maritima TaxID=2761123 RepID=A0A5J6WBM1_9SPIR|nr:MULTISPECIES: DUF5425 family lipoprotein [Borrelia]QFI15074.1 hypothetical protein DB723_05125 [Borrelia maritima]WKC83945.1 DUF5425 family lipoprotein [Borrelia sp. CA_690]